MSRGAAAVLFGEALVDDFGGAEVVGGAPFNVARHLAAFHVPQLMITRVGSDDAGRRVRAEFERFGMADDGLQADLSLPTGRVLVREGLDGHTFTILPHQAYDAIDAALAVQALATVDPALLYFGTLAQRAAPSRGALSALLDATPVPRFLDLNLRDGQVDERRVFASLQAADVVKVNEDELQSLFGWYVQGAPAGAEQG
ncbi:MAG TPA: PfkB family carbohydrate kinase, partial [Telluria sp.]|nr:PfkB family carbohydrate kinase [Telluria sp.]